MYGAAALFSAVNESIWEHLKLLYFPVLLYTILEVIVYGEKIPGFLYARTLIQKWRRGLSARKATAALILFGVTALFFIFTFYPPHIGLFIDPAAGIYGIPKQTRLESYLGK